VTAAAATVAAVTDPAPQRPALSTALTGAELRRWYWLKEELVHLARELGTSTAGGKELLTGRVAAALDGVAPTEPAPASRRSAGRSQLTGTLDASTRIPEGQRCSQLVRAWLRDQVGGSFRFDAEMRAFFASTDGSQTMQDALDHWCSTRGQGATSIEPQFELNRFTRAWYQTHPGGSREQLMEAWREYRSHPVDERGRV
jgi:hypothetical protein